MTDFGKILRQLRKNHHFTQKKAAEAFSISYSALQRTEEGRRELTYSELERIAEYCKKSIDDILHLGDEPKSVVMQPSPSKREEHLESIILAQNEQITLLLGEIRNVYVVVTQVIAKEKELIQP